MQTNNGDFTVSRDDVLREARLCVARNIRYQHQGRSEDGLDCVGAPLRYLLKAGWTPRSPETTNEENYARLPEGDKLRAYLEREAREVGFDEIQACDFALMACHHDERNRTPNHLALFTPPPEGLTGWYVIHALNDKGVVEHIWADEWPPRTVAVYRLLDWC